MFALLGTTYGGNGSSNFQLPNLQGKAILGTGTSQSGQVYNAGKTGGAETTALTINNLPAHSHVASAQPHTHSFSVPPHTHPFSPQCDNDGGSDPNPAGEYPGNGGVYSTAHAQTMGAQTTGQNTDGSGNTAATAVAVMVQNTGNGLPISTMGPYVAINYIIAYQGVFPPRP